MQKFFSEIFRIALAALVVTTTGDRIFAQTSSGNSTVHNDRLRFENADAPEFKEKGFWRPAKATPEEQFKHAQNLENEGSLRSATRAYNALVSEWSASPIARQAQLKVAEMYKKRGRTLDAFKQYQYFIEMFAGVGDSDFNDVVARQAALANTEFERMKGGGLFSSSDPEVVAEMFRKVVSNAPDWERAPESQLKRGMAFEQKKAWLDAALAYEALAIRYPNSNLRADALYLAAFARVKLSDKYPRDERTLRNAVSALRMAYVNDSENKTAETALTDMKRLLSALSRINFAKAEFYDKIRNNPNAAIIAYKSFIANFPDTEEAKTAKKRITTLEDQMK